MKNEIRVISAIVNGREIAPVLNCSNVDSLFDSYKDVWEYIRDYYYKHREVVSKEVILEAFPEMEIIDTTGTVKHYLEQLTKDYQRARLEKISRGLARDLDNKPLESLIDAVQGRLLEIINVGSSVKDLDITDDKKAVDHYIDTRAKMEANGGVLGIRTGYDSIDANYVTGMAPGQYIAILSRTGMGKRLRIDEPIPTPDGWTTMGSLKPGMKVFGSDGCICNVTRVSEIEYKPDAYKVILSDGAEIEADLDHQWLTTTRLERRNGDGPKVRTTKEILSTLRHLEYMNHAIPVAQAIELENKVFPLHPYILGLWLGDGTSREPSITMHIDDWSEIKNIFTEYGIKHHLVDSQAGENTVSIWMEETYGILRKLGVRNNKHIPAEYLRGSIEQRWALLQGLMDSDGTSGTDNASLELSFSNEILAKGAAELIRSLGIRTNCNRQDAKLYGVRKRDRWRMSFVTKKCPFKLTRKVSRWIPATEARTKYRYIKDVVPVEPTPMRCITVDSPDHTYVASRDWIVTHNSWLALDIAINAWIQGKRVLYISLEMPPEAVRDRAYTLMSEGLFSMSDLSRANVNLDQITKWAADKLRDDRSFIVTASDSMGDFSPSHIQGKIDQYGPDIVFVDYLQLMTDKRNSSGETERVRNASKEIKSIAMTNGIPIVVVAAASSHETKEYNSPPQIYECAASRMAVFDVDLLLSLISQRNQDGSHLMTIVSRKSRHGPDFGFMISMDIPNGKISELWEEPEEDTGLIDEE